jgi:HPt (histidine-containing phosphotransfer) domain-containing protein
MAEPIERAALDELVAMTGGERAFLGELIDTFVTDAASMLAELDAAVAAGDDAALLRPAHSLKSNALSFGAHRLTELCRAVEADARNGAVPDAAARVATIRDEVAAVQGALLAERDATG